jgi:hypothetical protein
MFAFIRAASSLFSQNLVLPILAVLLIPSHALAQNETDTATHFYVTAGAVLESSFEFAGQTNDLEEEGSGFYLGGGYSFNDMISLELGYTGANDYTNNAGQYSDVKMYELSGLTHIRMKNPFSPYLRLGLYQASSDASNTSENEGNGFLYGFGVDYTLSDGQYLRFDFTPGNIEGDELARLMIGLSVDLQ